MGKMNEQNMKMEQMMRQFINNQLARLEEGSEENNNSFAFLEKSTLNVLLTYLLLEKKPKASEEINEDVHLSIVNQLDQAIDDNKKEFESMIHFLKNFS